MCNIEPIAPCLGLSQRSNGSVEQCIADTSLGVTAVRLRMATKLVVTVGKELAIDDVLLSVRAVILPMSKSELGDIWQ